MCVLVELGGEGHFVGMFIELSAHGIAAVEQARAVLVLVKRSFINLTPTVFLPLYYTLVLPHLESAIRTTSPYVNRDNDHTEFFQRLATPIVKRTPPTL